MMQKICLTFPKRENSLAELFGILTGDGFMNYYPDRQAYTIEISGNKLKDKEYLEQYVSPLIERLFNFKPKIYIAKKQNTIYLVARSKEIFNFLKDNDFVVGKKGEIIIPEWIKDNESYFKEFIKGLFDTDGHICFKNKEGKKYPVAGITSKSKSLLIPIYAFLKTRGISSYFGSHRSDRNNRECIVHRIQISGKNNIGLFFKEIGSNNSRNLLKLNGFGGNRTPVTRASVEYSPIELRSH